MVRRLRPWAPCLVDIKTHWKARAGREVMQYDAMQGAKVRNLAVVYVIRTGFVTM